MLASSLFTSLVLALGANAIMVTYPGKRDTWSTSGSQTIKWDSVSTDATSFDIVLVNQDSSYLARTTTLAEKVSTSDGQATVSFPGGNFPAGQSFQVNLIRTDQDNSILAQSPMFDIVQSAAQTTAQTTTAQATTTGRATAAMGTTTANSLPKTLSAAVASASSAAGSAASSGAAAAESGGVSIPAGNTNGALSSLSSSALLVVGAAVVGAAALF